MVQTLKNLPAMRETWVPSPGWEDPLEEGVATHSAVLAWRIPMDRGAWWATVRKVAKSQTGLSDEPQQSSLRDQFELKGLVMTESTDSREGNGLRFQE